MENVIKKPFSRKKKISLDINDEVLKLIDDLAKLTKNSRTIILESIIHQGLSPFINLLEKRWKEMFIEENSEIKKITKELLKDLKEIKEKYEWINPNYYQKMLNNKDLDEETKKKIKKLLEDTKLM